MIKNNQKCITRDSLSSVFTYYVYPRTCHTLLFVQKQPRERERAVNIFLINIYNCIWRNVGLFANEFLVN